METAESLGFIQYWGASKWLNLANEKEGDLKILISGGCDMRHIFKTCLDAKEGTQLTFYVHEKFKEPFCRQLLMMLIAHTTNLNFRERTDLFLDVFGNTLVRDKT
jgi:dynein assembly factor 3, axonemal